MERKKDMDVYDIYDEFIKKLSQMGLLGRMLTVFKDIEDVFGGVTAVEKALINFKFIDRILNRYELKETKSNSKSSEFRMLGNEKFALKNREYYQALELYNKSICFSEPGSENLSIGYANRSAVFFEWKRYKECLMNIDLARKANYPARLMHKLNKREKECRQLVQNQLPDVKPYEFKMNFDSHPTVPNIANCLELKESPEEGRYIVTNQDLHVGDVVAIEEAFCTSLLKAMRYIRCATCKQENFLTLIPCESCCSTMFCSEECRDKALTTFHKYECPIIDMIHSLFNKVHSIALRVCLSALELFPTVEELIAFCDDPDNQNKSVFDLDYSNMSPREHYRAIHGLATNQHIRTPSDLVQKAVTCALLKHFLINYTPLKDFLGGQQGEEFFTVLLFRHLQTSPTNMHSIDLAEQVNETKDDQSHSSGAFAFLSLLNHSCAPNVVRVYQNTTAYLFVLRPIYAGGMLFDNYGAHFAVSSKTERIETLDNQYYFICKCEACLDNYPSYTKLPNKPHISKISTAISDVSNLTVFNYDYALENYTKYCDYLDTYGDEYPCSQISFVEESLKMALHILVDAVPLKAKMQ